MRLSSRYPKLVNIFLDEIDWVVAADKKYNYQFIIGELLSAVMTDKITLRLWMAGFKDLYKAATNRKDPMFGKTRTIELGPLSMEETRQLVIKPMSHLGFSFEDETGLTWRI